MSARVLLIDGYNLLHAAGMGRSTYGPGDLQRCRERLLRYLVSRLSAAELNRATVIFDAREPPPDRPARQVFRGLKVEFANPGGDADVMIQKWLDQHSSPKQVTLVSSDHALQRWARGHRARFIDSEEFFDELEHRDAGSAHKGGHTRNAADTKQAEGLSAAEAEHWLTFFGDLSRLVETEVARRPEAEAPAPPPPSVGKTSQSARTPPVSPGKNAPSRAKRARKPGKQQRVGSSRNKPRVSTDDVAYWLEIFGQLPEAEDLFRGKGIQQADLERWLQEFGNRKD